MPSMFLGKLGSYVFRPLMGILRSYVMPKEVQCRRKRFEMREDNVRREMWEREQIILLSTK